MISHMKYGAIFWCLGSLLRKPPFKKGALMEMSHIRPLYRRGENSTITTFGSIQCAQNIVKKTPAMLNQTIIPLSPPSNNPIAFENPHRYNKDVMNQPCQDAIC